MMTTIVGSLTCAVVALPSIIWETACEISSAVTSPARRISFSRTVFIVRRKGEKKRKSGSERRRCGKKVNLAPYVEQEHPKGI
jgi:hypothetical protein